MLSWLLRPRCKEQGSLSISLWIDLDDPPSTDHAALGACTIRFYYNLGIHMFRDPSSELRRSQCWYPASVANIYLAGHSCLHWGNPTSPHLEY